MSKVRIKIENNEIEIDGSDEFISNHLSELILKLENTTKTINPSSIKSELVRNPYFDTSKTPTPAEYFRGRRKTDGISQILLFAKYLELYKNQSEFSRNDINQLVKEAKLPRDIHSQYYTNAVKQGLLRVHGKKYTITLTGEDYISSLQNE